MKIGKAREPGVAGTPRKRKRGDPKPEGYVFGRPTSYRPEYCQAMINYFADPSSWEIYTDAKGSSKALPKGKLPTFERFAAGIGVNDKTLYDWTTKYPEFKEAHTTAMSLQKAFLLELSAAGIGNSIVGLILRANHGMREEHPEDSHANETIQKVVVEVVGASKPQSD